MQGLGDGFQLFFQLSAGQKVARLGLFLRALDQLVLGLGQGLGRQGLEGLFDLLAGVFDAPNPGLSLGLGDPGLG